MTVMCMRRFSNEAIYQLHASRKMGWKARVSVRALPTFLTLVNLPTQEKTCVKCYNSK